MPAYQDSQATIFILISCASRILALQGIWPGIIWETSPYETITSVARHKIGVPITTLTWKCQAPMSSGYITLLEWGEQSAQCCQLENLWCPAFLLEPSHRGAQITGQWTVKVCVADLYCPLSSNFWRSELTWMFQRPPSWWVEAHTCGHMSACISSTLSWPGFQLPVLIFYLSVIPRKISLPIIGHYGL